MEKEIILKALDLKKDYVIKKKTVFNPNEEVVHAVAGVSFEVEKGETLGVIGWTRRFLASAIVYQSRFCEENWNAVHGPVSKPSTIIYNGVDTDRFSPIRDPENWRTSEPIRVLIAEKIGRAHV